jgi:hypothetical protein
VCDGEEGEEDAALSPATNMRRSAGGSDVGWTEVDMLTFYVGVDNFAHPLDRNITLPLCSSKLGYRSETLPNMEAQSPFLVDKPNRQVL